MCDECRISNDSRRLSHALIHFVIDLASFVHWVIECQVFQYVPSTSISEQFERILLALCEMMVINAWSRYFVELLRVRLVLPTHNIVPHISWHDLPCHRTTKRYEYFPSMVVFQFSTRNFWIQTWFCNCQQYLCLFHIVFEYTPGIHDQGMMLVLPNQLLC